MLTFRVLLRSAILMTGLGLLPAAGPSALAQTGLPDFTELVEKNGPSVVNIRTTETVRRGAGGSLFPGMPELDENDPLYEFFRRMIPPNRRGEQAPDRGDRGQGDGPGREVPRGVGSGFVLSADGYIMTNAHVIRGADDVYVTLTDKREFKAKVIGADQRTDVAVVKIEAAGLPAVRIGDPNRVKVGEWVLAIGSPFGLDNTVTAGIVSAKSRDTGDYLPFIQTDVAVNPGNSGGPLINMRGEVIGINSQIYSRTGSFSGISFSIPIDEAMRVGDQLRTSGKISRGRIGVGIEQVTKDVAESIGLGKPAGALVTQVQPGTPADKAGVKEGDIITKFDGKMIEKSGDLPRIVGNTKPGSKVTLTVFRKGKTQDLAVTVAEAEPDKTAAKGADKEKDRAAKDKEKSNSLGLVVSDLTDAKRKDAKVTGGVLVDAADGAAAGAGIRAGDIILIINNQDVTGAKQFAELVAKLEIGKPASLLIKRGDTSRFVAVRPEKK